MSSRLLHWIFIALLSLQPAFAGVTWTATPFNPPSFPLAVRTPYLSAWLPQGQGASLNDVWAQLWTGQTLGWAGFVKVDGTAYSFLGASTVSGASFQKAVQKSSLFTATKSVFVLSAGPVDLTVTFLSPVEATDLVKQSLPFSYLSVSAASTNGAAHAVQIYTDISAEFVTGDTAQTVNWATTSGDVLTHQVQLSTQVKYAEVNDQTQYGSTLYSTLNTLGATFQSGQDTLVRAAFISNGKLANTQDTAFRAVRDRWPVFALAHDLGAVTAASSPVVFSIGHVRDPAVQYISAGGVIQERSIYYRTQFSSTAAVVSTFLKDYGAALSRATTFDSKVRTDASKISADYASVVDLSIRQALAGMEITTSKNVDGTWNADDIIVFMKEISSDGNVNTVDVIAPAWPVLLYTNPVLGKYLLEGLFRYQATGQYPNKWSVHDLGSSYPKATGHNDGNDEAMPVEESGNMLIMTLSHFQKTGDSSLITKYASLLDQWTQFLISDSLIPANQLSTDDFAGHLANQTNLAIKGMIGIKAMALIETALGNKDKSANYSTIAASYVNQWQTLAASSTGKHFTLAYGDLNSWGLSYNLYGDKLLKLNLFPTSVYNTQTAWYKTVANSFGVPLDTRHTYTKTDWEIWTAAIVTDTSVRDLLISSVKEYASSGLSSQPFGDWYETTNGNAQGFRARPVVGGHLAFLAL